MVYRYNMVERAIIEHVADLEGVDPIKLGEMYADIMSSNFEQDLHDIAKDMKGE